MKDISGMTLPEMQIYLEKIGEKPYRAAQVFRWIYTEYMGRWDY